MLTALAIHCEAHQQSRTQITDLLLHSDVAGEHVEQKRHTGD
jgi:hypothetical protein